MGDKNLTPSDRRDNVTRSAVADSLPSVELKVSTRSHAGHALVAIAGEIDLYTAPRLQSEFTRLLQDGPSRVVIDMSHVEFCDSTGMNVLLSALKRVKEQGGQLDVAAPRPAVRKILQVTGLDSVFTVHETVPEEFLISEGS